MAFNNYLEDENDKPYFTTNSLGYYYDKMEGFAEKVEQAAKVLNVTKEEVEKNIAAYIEQNKTELDQRLAQWDGKLETFDSSVETLLSEWVDDGTLTPLIDSTLINQKIAPVSAQLAETAAQLKTVEDGIKAIDRGIGETFSTLFELNAAYPTGGTERHVVAENGEWYYWKLNSWVSGGTFNAVAIPDIFQKYGTKTEIGNPLNLMDIAKGTRFKSLTLSGVTEAVNVLVSGENVLPNPKGDLIQNASVVNEIPNGFHVLGNNTTTTGFSVTRGQVYFDNLPAGSFYLSFKIKLVTAHSSEQVRVISNNLTKNDDLPVTTTEKRVTLPVTIGADNRLIFRLNSNELIVTDIMLSNEEGGSFEPFSGGTYLVSPGVARVDIVGDKNVFAKNGTLTVTYNVDTNYYIQKLMSDDMEDDPDPLTEQNVYLHKIADLNIVVGDKFEIFEEGLINYKKLPEPYQLEINKEANAIFKYRSNGRFLFDTAGITAKTSFHSAFYMRNRKGEIIDSSPYYINVVTPPVNPSTPKNILIMGDSLSANGQYPTEFKRRLTEEFGLTNFKFVGARLISGINMEATGGYHWTDYTSPTSELVSPHVNRFWNDTTGKLDFKKYMTDYAAGASLDYMVITLGTNDHAKGERDMVKLRARMVLFMNQLRLDYPNCKVVLVGQHKAPSVIFEEGDNYWLDRDIWMNSCSEMYKGFANDVAYSSFVKFVDTQVLFDNNGGAEGVNEQVGLHSIPNIQRRITDYVHPNVTGYNYYANALLGGFFAIQ